jgi:serine/threonine protein kinase
MPIVAGDVLSGRYKIMEKADSGTLADLWVAYDTLLNRKVIVKPAKEGEWDAGPGHYPAGIFEKEARIAAGLEHPHLLPVYDYGRHGDNQYLVMRVFNATLREYIRRFDSPKGMPLDVAMPLFQRIASAIDYLHEKGPIVHGNLKPNTIVLDTESGSQIHPFISDFGVAARGAEGIGTPLYIAPEQVSGGKVLPATDLFSLGVILYECLTGVLPYRGDNMSSILYQKMHPEDGQYSVRKIRTDIPVGVDVVVERLTRPEPSERYPCAVSAIEDMTRAFYSGQSEIGGTVFISYARKEREYVHALAQRLRSIGIKLWTDQDIQPGANWDRSVEEALKDTECMLVIMSPTAVQSENVQDEWSYFLEEGKPVYPFIYQSCELPLRLRRRQHIKSTGDMLTDISRIVDVLAGGTASSPIASDTPPGSLA